MKKPVTLTIERGTADLLYTLLVNMKPDDIRAIAERKSGMDPEALIETHTAAVLGLYTAMMPDFSRVGSRR